MDDILGDHIGRSSLGTENAYQSSGWLMSGFDLQVLMDQEKQVQLLTLILMEPLCSDA